MGTRRGWCDCPAVATEQADHHPHKSGLAGTVGSEHAEYLPFRHGKREAVQYLVCAVAEREVTGFDYGGGLGHGSVGASPLSRLLRTFCRVDRFARSHHPHPSPLPRRERGLSARQSGVVWRIPVMTFWVYGICVSYMGRTVTQPLCLCTLRARIPGPFQSKRSC